MSHHVSNNFISASTNNQGDLTTAKADIIAIKAKTDNITISNPANISTMETGIASNLAAIQANDSDIASNLAARQANDSDIATVSNNLQTSINNVTALTAVVVTHATNLAILNEMTKNFILAANTDVIFYTDAHIRLSWDSTNYQPKFQWVSVDAPATEWVDGGLRIVRRASGTDVSLWSADDILNLNSSIAAVYFTDQGVLNTAFNGANYGFYFEAWVLTENNTTKPSYIITGMMGSVAGSLRVRLEKIFN